MPEAKTEREPEKPKKELIDVLYHRLGVGEMNASLIINGVLREVILSALIRGNILTKEELTAALDRAEKEMNEICAEAQAEPVNDAITETISKMRDRAKHITDGIRERIIDGSSPAPQQ